jgi:uncharacterized protein (DUF362 family)
VKPNDTWATKDDTTAVTQPDTLGAVLRNLRRFEPAELIVSGGAGGADTGDVFERAGLAEVVEREGATFFDHNRPPFEEIELSHAPEREGPRRSVVVNSNVLRYETLVSLAQIKVHEASTVTLALKNVAMSFPAGDYYGRPRSALHHESDLHSFIASMVKRFPISLAILAGHPVMVGHGPIGGHVVETGMIIASTDPLAADVVGARLLGFAIESVRHLWEAQRLGVGVADLEKVTFPALSLWEAAAMFWERVYGSCRSPEYP